MEDKLVSPPPFLALGSLWGHSEHRLLPAWLYVLDLMRIMQMGQVPNENVSLIYTELWVHTRLHREEFCQANRLGNQQRKAQLTAVGRQAAGGCSDCRVSWRQVASKLCWTGWNEHVEFVEIQIEPEEDLNITPGASHNIGRICYSQPLPLLLFLKRLAAMRSTPSPTWVCFLRLFQSPTSVWILSPVPTFISFQKVT